MGIPHRNVVCCSHENSTVKSHGDTGIWSTGYFVSTVGLNEANIKKYIDRQNDFDRGIDLTGEFE